MKLVKPTAVCIHDIKNKLTLIDLYCRRASRKMPMEEFDSIHECVHRVADLLRELGQVLENEKKPIGLSSFEAFEAKTVKSLQRINKSYGMEINYHCNIKSRNFFVRDSEDYLHRILENLIDNAFKASSKKIKIDFFDDIDRFYLCLIDDGKIQRDLAFKTGTLALTEFADLPSGIGKHIVTESLRLVGGECVWKPDDEGEGQMCMLSFPKVQSLVKEPDIF